MYSDNRAKNESLSQSPRSRFPTPSQPSEHESVSLVSDYSPNTSPLPPPIILQSAAWKQVAAKLLASVPPQLIFAKPSGLSSVKFSCPNSEVFRTVQKFLKQSKTDFHTFTLPEDKLLKVIIRGLPLDTTESELSDDLFEKRYEVKNVRQFGNAIKKIPIFLVTLPLNPHSKNIFNEYSILFMSAKIERFRSNTSAQCFSCQRFGHSSLHCGYPPRSANCQGTHTANYKKCPALLKIIKAKRLISKQNNQQPSTSTPLPITTPLPTTTPLPSTTPLLSATPLQTSISNPKMSYASPTVQNPNLPHPQTTSPK